MIQNIDSFKKRNLYRRVRDIENIGAAALDAREAAGDGKRLNLENDLTSPVVFRNSTLLVALTLVFSVACAFLSGCMLLLTVGPLFEPGRISAAGYINMFWWGFGALVFGSMCPSLWQTGRRMGYYRAELDMQAVDFRFGTKKNPQPLRMEWDKIGAVEHKRTGSAHYYTIAGSDGSTARFSTYSFLGAKKLANLIALRAHKTIVEV